MNDFENFFLMVTGIAIIILNLFTIRNLRQARKNIEAARRTLAEVAERRAGEA